MNNWIQKGAHLCALFLCTLALVTAGFFVLSSFDLSARGSEKARRIGVSYMTMNNEFYRVVGEQISARIRAEGDRVILRNPALDAVRQREEIQRMLKEGIDGLILTPVEIEGLSDVLGEAREKGIPIVVVDTRVSDEKLVDCSVVSDNYLAGSLIGDYYLKKHKEGRVLLVTHEETASGRDRVQGFLDRVSENPAITVAGRIDGLGQMERVLPLVEAYLASGEEFDSVFCLNDPSAIGVLSAFAASERDTSGIDVYGVDGSPDAKGLIEAGKLEATVTQYPSMLGAKAADVLYRLLDGEEVERSVIVPVEMVTKENVSAYQADRWL